MIYAKWPLKLMFTTSQRGILTRFRALYRKGYRGKRTLITHCNLGGRFSGESNPF